MLNQVKNHRALWDFSQKCYASNTLLPKAPLFKFGSLIKFMPPCDVARALCNLRQGYSCSEAQALFHYRSVSRRWSAIPETWLPAYETSHKITREMKELIYKPQTKTVLDLVNLYQSARLNLNPEFQRNSVWLSKDRKKLIESILRGYPLPAIFLYHRNNNGKVIHDVIDGKQRLETIFMFIGVLRGKEFKRFKIKTQLKDSSEFLEIDWNYLKRKGKQSMIEMYELSMIEVDGDIADIIKIFVGINSTGKPLTSAEKQHAQYFKESPFLKVAANIAEKHKDYFITTGVLSTGQISRMKHIEF